jgi:hypothetical protein
MLLCLAIKVALEYLICKKKIKVANTVAIAQDWNIYVGTSTLFDSLVFICIWGVGQGSLILLFFVINQVWYITF